MLLDIMTHVIIHIYIYICIYVYLICYILYKVFICFIKYNIYSNMYEHIDGQRNCFTFEVLQKVSEGWGWDSPSFLRYTYDIKTNAAKGSRNVKMRFAKFFVRVLLIPSSASICFKNKTFVPPLYFFLPGPSSHGPEL
jgi:hypothetical protein